MITGNKGEWSELYTLFKVIADKKLNPGDDNLEPIKNIHYSVIEIMRNESHSDFKYKIDGSNVKIKSKFGTTIVPISEFELEAKNLLNAIKNDGKGAFSIPSTETFIKKFNCQSLKAKSSNKTDIYIKIHDNRSARTESLGFSIKSQLGGASTLLNASKATNFIYKVEGRLSKTDVNTINTIDGNSKILNRVKKISELGGKLKFEKTNNEVFSNNLILIDSFLPSILSNLLLKFFTSKTNTISDLIENIQNENPLSYNLIHGHEFYKYKIKRFLSDVALGMMPAKVWLGQLDANGGYLIVKENGDVLSYHIYDRNEFENYLYTFTKLETASSKKHDFGLIYNKDNNLYFNLNLQIRFIA